MENPLPALPTWIPTVNSVMAAAGVPWQVWVPICAAESTFNANAHNTGTPGHPEDSVGLFQLNRNGGQGAGHSVAELKDPKLNAQIAASYLGPAVQKCGADNIGCIAVNSGHPGPVSQTDPRILTIKTYHMAIASATSLPSAIGTLLTSVIPNIGGLLPDVPSIDVGAGITSGITGLWAGLFVGGRDVVIDRLAPWVMGATGISCLAWGILIASLKSDAGGAVTSAGESVPWKPVQIAAAGSRVIRGEPGKAVGSVVRFKGK